MQDRYIYVHSEGSHDLSRWLQISARRAGDVTLHLQDLCHPGRLSHLTSATCPLDFLQTSVNNGPLQITMATGYVLLRRQGEFLQIEFRGLEDGSPTKIKVLLDEVKAKLDTLGSVLEKVAAS